LLVTRLAGGGAVPAEILYRSDAPHPGDAAPDGVAAWPPGTVIDLRSPGESRAGYQWPDGMTVHHVPLLPEAAVVSEVEDAQAAAGREHLCPVLCCIACKVFPSANLGLMQTFTERTGLRERKKLATRRALRRVALDLVAERGFAGVTVEDIAEAANVSPRTFFNYFPSKEAVLFGPADPARVTVLRQDVAHAAPGGTALEALRVVMADHAQAVADELSELGGDPVDWVRRMKQARTDPHLRAAHAAQMAMLERAIAEGLAERLGTDPERDPYPGLLAATATSVFRASIAFWAGSGGTVPLGHLIDQSFRALADGLPEDCELRYVMRNKEDH
jgi:AcrR family transcriptional regulator